MLRPMVLTLKPVTKKSYKASLRSLPAPRTAPCLCMLAPSRALLATPRAVTGLAGLFKAIVMPDRELISPVAGFVNPKPGLPLDRVLILTNMIPRPHAVSVTPRISINSFGFGGTNAHAILKRGPRPLQKTSAHDATFPRLFTLSANSPASLKAMIQAQYDWSSSAPKCH